MIDINMVRANGQNYSVKCSLTFENDDRGTVVTAKILNVDLIEPIDATSYKKLKTVFASSGSDMLNKTKYASIYSAITQKLVQKFRMNVLNI